ncbi:MAG: ABC transporter permease, partial [Peptococcaceae bacterium]|nr:ABC transporter permease [Peptococcaceae bacterium]
MNLQECILVALEGIRSNKMRLGLTMLGIIIGVAAVITVVAIGQGGRSAIMNELENVGTNLFMVYPQSTEQAPVTLADMITVQDLEIIKNVAPDIKYISPVNDRSMPARYERISKRVYVYGVWPEFKNIRNIKLEKGRFLSAADEQGARRVVVIDSKLATDLFGRQEALHQQIDIFGLSLTVIGITKRNDSFLMGGPDQPSTVYIPFSTFQSIDYSGIVYYAEASAVSKEKTESAMSQAKQILNNRHHTENIYQTYSLQQELEEINTVMAILQLVIGSIAAISLLVGG